MVKIGRNDLCPCGSGKKYKNCCLKDSEAINIISYKYDKYLEARNLACGKVFAIGTEKLGIEGSDPTFYLLEFLLNKVDVNKIKSIQDLDYFIDDTSFIFTIFGYPIYDLMEFDGEPDDFGFNTDSIEDNYLWRYCLANYIDEFTELEKKFLHSLNDSTAGFFKVLNTGTGENSPSYPVIEIEDIFNGRVYKIMDKSLYNGVVKHDIISGIIAPFHEDISVMESCPPILYPPPDKELLLKLIKEYSRVYKSRYRHLFPKKNDHERLFKLFPVIIYLVSLDYFLIRLTRPLPKMVNYDKEEIVLSETSYKVKDKEKIKKLLINIRGIRLTEDSKKEAILNWMNKKNTILGTIFLKNKRLLFQTNSLERLEKWKDMVKDIPIKYLKTDYTYLDDIQVRYSKVKKNSREDKVEDKGINIPEEDFKKIALDWWEKYYNDWVETKIPALGNVTPKQAVKTSSGRERVKTLIDEFENSNLHINKDAATGNNFHKYFDPDELRKRLSLI